MEGSVVAYTKPLYRHLPRGANETRRPAGFCATI
jgi:hypothetical protein